MADEHLQALSDCLHRAVNLRVITQVGDAQISGNLLDIKVEMPAAEKVQGSIVTDINIVGGDITRIISDSLLSPARAELVQAHEASVQQAQDIIERNVKIMLMVAKELAGLAGVQLPAPRA